MLEIIVFKASETLQILVIIDNKIQVAFHGKYIFEKRYASIRETRMRNKVKSYLESLKYQKGIRVLHDFHGGSIALEYEVSVKSF